MRRLDLESERFAPTGNLSGAGIQKSLGATTLDALRIMVREACQNVWDARKGDKTVLFRMHLKPLKGAQRSALQEMLGALPSAGDAPGAIRASLGKKSLWVLELSDFGTRGLAGPVRADHAARGREKPDFVNFLRNIGSARDEKLGAGTYGYGKSSLYNLSCCRTIIVYTQTSRAGRHVTRFMGASIGGSYEYKDREYTGRHWWGLRATDRHVDPVERDQAHRLARSLGLEQRDSEDTGTSILILDPDLEHRSPTQAANAIAESLAWFFWPKMLPRHDGTPAMKFEVMVDETEVRVPGPDEMPPLKVFAEAMKLLKRGSEKGSREIRCERPIMSLGRMSLAKGPWQRRYHLDTGDDDSLLPEHCSHVALMRPAELVVKYLECAPIASDMVEYGGVFVCDDEVEVHFADAEPPAHDDWLPGRVEDPGRRFVRVALKRVREEADRFASPQPGDVARPDQPSLAHIGDLLGGVLLGQDGGGPGRQDSPPKPPRRGKGVVPSEARVSEPEAMRPLVVRKVPCALFRVTVSVPEGREVRLHATPRIVLEGGGKFDAEPGGPHVVAWLDANGNMLAEGPDAVFDVSGEIPALVAISITGDCAVTVSMHAEGGT
jgi:hypothetical protein